MKATPKQIQQLAQRDPIYCQVQRNAIWFHRNQMRWLAQLGRERGGLNQPFLDNMRSHAQEIKQIYREIDQACGYW